MKAFALVYAAIAFSMMVLAVIERGRHEPETIRVGGMCMAGRCDR